MDQLSNSQEALHLISLTLIFLQNVIADSPTPTKNSAALETCVSFLDAFSEVCFSNMTGLLRDARVHPALGRDVERSLYSLSKSIAAHRELWRYIAMASDAKQNNFEGMANLSLEEKNEQRKWRDGMRELSQIWKQKTQSGLYEALFGQEELETLVSTCEKWIARLRQTLEIILLTVGQPHTALSKSQLAMDLGVVEVLERQSRANKGISDTYNALPGKLRDAISATQATNGVSKTIYKDNEDEVDVLVETRPDSEMSTESLCQLTWLLESPVRNNYARRTFDYQLSMLNCMGFTDDPINKRGLILYRSPQSHPWSSPPPSMHAHIMKGSASKLSLTGRFRTARDLTATILETHASGWMHKKLSSRTILLLPQTLNDSEPSPFLVGWGGPQGPEASAFELEPSLYQHQDQFGKPACEYENLHDIYSLGVVLLELGLWRTMSSIFARRLEQTPRFSATHQLSLYKTINRMLVELADSLEMKREMGERYADIVLKCLTWRYRDHVEGMIEFRKQVVDALATGNVF